MQRGAFITACSGVDDTQSICDPDSSKEIANKNMARGEIEVNPKSAKYQAQAPSRRVFHGVDLCPDYPRILIGFEEFY